VSDVERVLAGFDFAWPNPSKPMMFLVNNGSEEMSATGTSFLNRTEGATVEKFVTNLLKAGITPDQIGYLSLFSPSNMRFDPRYYCSIELLRLTKDRELSS